MTKSKFSQWLSREVVAAGLSTEAVARLVGCSRDHTDKLIKGQSKPGRNLAIAFAVLFDAEHDEILELAGFKPAVKEGPSSDAVLSEPVSLSAKDGE